jgi:hypothetical protein
VAPGRAVCAAERASGQPGGESMSAPASVRPARPRPARHLLPSILLALALVGTATPALAQLGQVNVGLLRLVYFEGSESYLVPHAARAFLTSMAFQERLWDYHPWGKVTVLLADFSDTGDASAGTIPRNTLQIQIAPLNYSFETLSANDRLIVIMNHELVHVATMDGAAGSDRVFRRLFGGKVVPIAEQPESILYFYLTSPRVAAPRWYFEGSAVFTDTWMAGGIGRAQGGYDEMVFRAKVRDGARFYDPLGLVSEGTKVDFQLQINSYLYGERFMTWLAYRYSPEKFVEWLSRKPGSRAYYASQFRHVYGRSIEDAWAEWVAFEHAFQQKNLEAIRTFPVTPTHDVSPRALGSISRSYYDPSTRTIYGAFDYQGAVANVGAISLDTGKIEHLVDIKGPVIYTVTSLAWDPASRTLFYTTDNAAYRDLVALDPATKKTRLLLKDARIGSLAFDQADGSIWGIRDLNGLCTFVRIPRPYTEWHQVKTFPYGTVPYDLDVSRDGRRLSASFGEVDGKQNVRVFEIEKLLAGDATPIAQFDMGLSVPQGFVFSSDGRYLYGSSYYTGVSNIYRYDLAAGKVEALTNAETGFFRPIPLEGNDLLVFRYSGDGFVPTRITVRPTDDINPITFLGQQVIEKHPELQQWQVPPPSRIPYDTLPKQQGPYHVTSSIGVESVYPIVQGYKDTQAVGIRLNLSDPLQLARFGLSASYSPAGEIGDGERLHLRAEVERYSLNRFLPGVWKARAELNNADFYDLFGPTKVGRKGYVFGLGHTRTLIFDDPRKLELNIDASYSGNLDRLPDYQNIPVAVDKLASVQVDLDYSNVQSSLGHVDDEKGRRAKLVAQADYAASEIYPHFYATFDQGFALPGRHHWSLWLRNTAGFSPRPADSVFSNFYFGGFGNNWVDHGDEKRYREWYSFPGADLNEIGGRNFVKSVLEWNLPPVRFSRAGRPGFYVSWMRPALFVGGLGTNLDDPSIRHVLADVGGQLDFQFTILSTLDMMFSIGGAVAFEKGHGPRREAMASLKILR